MSRRGIYVGLTALVVGSAPFIGIVFGGPFTQKGTQPGLSVSLQRPFRCQSCHGGNFDPVYRLEPHDTWSGSMMAQASRDPLFWAALDVANNDVAGVGDFCLRCHVPQGWLEGRSEPPGGSVDGCGLVGNLDAVSRQFPMPAVNTDFEGVTCHVCHRMMVNPFPPGGEDPVYFENGQYWLDDVECPDGYGDICRRGPYDYLEPDEVIPPHDWIYSDYHVSADNCGNCHNVTSPTKTLIENGVDTGVPFPVERTFKEYQQSAYAVAGPGFKTCQNCHMPDATAANDPLYPCIELNNDRNGNLPIHEFVGGNAWIPDVLRQEYLNLPLAMADQLLETRNAAVSMLQNQSATVEITVPSQAAPGQSLPVQVKVTNITGHKLPTGYPEGRRMWLNLEARDGTNALIWESGAYDQATGVLTQDPAIKIYQTKPGIWNLNGSATCDAADGTGSPIFHFVLNDCIAKDNRIPPLGFSGMSHPETKPVNYVYPETTPGSGVLVNYDVTSYSVPVPLNATSPITVTATLHYQTSSKEYVDFLRDEAVENNFPDDCTSRSTGPINKSRGEFMHELWGEYGKSPPVAMGAVSGVAAFAPTPGEASGVGANRLRVTSYDELSGDLTLTYDPACGATDHAVYIGNLASVATMNFTGQECFEGTSGTATINLGKGSYFWLIVGNDGADEGSYGTNSAGVERPEDTGLTTCSYPQDLTQRCD